MKLLHALALSSVLSASLVLAQTPAPAKSTTPAASTKTAKPAAAPAPSAADIANAKSKGLVGANLNTKVYHFSTDSTYGTTKNGKFMTEADAKTAGYRRRKRAQPKPPKLQPPSSQHPDAAVGDDSRFLFHDAIPSPTRLAAAIITSMPAHSNRKGLSPHLGPFAQRQSNQPAAQHIDAHVQHPVHVRTSVPGCWPRPTHKRRIAGTT